jgi:hypothetical protein
MKDIKLRQFCIRMAYNCSADKCGAEKLVSDAMVIHTFLTDSTIDEPDFSETEGFLQEGPNPKKVCYPNNIDCPRYEANGVIFKKILHCCDENSDLCPRKPVQSHG